MTFLVTIFQQIILINIVHFMCDVVLCCWKSVHFEKGYFYIEPHFLLY